MSGLAASAATTPAPSAKDRARTTVITWATFVGLAAVGFTVSGHLGDGLLELFSIAFGAAFWLGFIGVPASLVAEAVIAKTRAPALPAQLAIGLLVGALTAIATLTMPMTELFRHDPLLVNAGLVTLCASLMSAAHLLGWRLGQRSEEGESE